MSAASRRRQAEMVNVMSEFRNDPQAMAVGLLNRAQLVLLDCEINLDTLRSPWEAVAAVGVELSKRHIIRNTPDEWATKMFLLADIPMRIPVEEVTVEVAEHIVADPVPVEVVEAPVISEIIDVAPSAATMTTEAPPRKSRTRAYFNAVKEMIEAGTFTRKDIMDAILPAFPTLRKDTLYVFLTDCKNPKYAYFGRLVAEVDGKMKFVS